MPKDGGNIIMSRVKRQHITPRFLADLWAFDDDKVWVLRKTGDDNNEGVGINDLFKANVINVAVGKWFYGRDGEIEGYLSKEIEYSMAILLDMINFERIIRLSMDDRLAIAKFMFVQHMRTRSSKEFFFAAHDEDMDRAIGDLKLIFEDISLVDDKGEMIAMGDFIDMLEPVMRQRFDAASRWYDIIKLNELGWAEVERFALSRWTLYKAIGEQEFICSDEPVIVSDKSLEGETGVEILAMPVGPKYVLEICGGRSDCNFRKTFDDESVRNVNKRIALQSRQIFGTSAEIVKEYEVWLGRQLS